MKRRSFICTGAAAAFGAGVAGCSRGITVRQELSPYAFDKIVSKPVGTMPYAEIGTTGIKVSKFGFGSHLRRDLVTLAEYPPIRERMVHEAYDMGINLFDIYDKELECYQYEPMGRYLKPYINDVVISISLLPYDGRTLEQEFERDLKVLGRDYIDMVRIHSYNRDPQNTLNREAIRIEDWTYWEKLFKWKEQGKIRAVGIPIHCIEDIEEPLAAYPLDYVIFPFNFYHNWTWHNYEVTAGEYRKYDSLIPRLRKKGVGVISMKPFASDDLVTPFRKLGAELDESGEVNVAKASLKYVINSDLNVDTTLGGMYYPYHVRENVDTYFNPSMTDEEKNVLSRIRKKARRISYQWMPEYHQFLEDWAPMAYDDSDLKRMV